MKVRTNLPINLLTSIQKKEFSKWVQSKRTFINLTLPDGRVFSARKETN